MSANDEALDIIVLRELRDAAFDRDVIIEQVSLGRYRAEGSTDDVLVVITRASAHLSVPVVIDADGTLTLHPRSAR